MLPEGFLKRLKTQEYIDQESLINALNEPVSVSIRVNRSKWKAEPVNDGKVPWCSSGYYLKQRPSYTLDPLFHSGCYYPQESSGMFIEEVLRQVENENKFRRVLDLCAAPGGKSTLLSSFAGNDCILVANEVIRSRASILADNISRWGTGNCVVSQSDPSSFSSLTGFFDLVLVDAPCSGEGMFRDQTAVDEWSEVNTALCAERQKRILSDVWPALKAGGILIYSTCTFNPAENELNVRWLLDNHEAGSVKIDISGFNCITEINYKDVYGYGFYPGRVKGEGLFISVIRKTGGSSDKKVKGGTKLHNELKKSDCEIAAEWTSFNEKSLMRINDELYSIPGTAEDYQAINSFIRLISPGVKIATIKKNKYVPAHDLALSARIREDAFAVTDLDYHSALHMLRRDVFSPASVPDGLFVARYKGVNLGFCNNIGNRINNYFPVNWRIRMNIPGDAIARIPQWIEL